MNVILPQIVSTPVVAEAYTRAERQAFFSLPDIFGRFRAMSANAERYLLAAANPYFHHADCRLFICKRGATPVARAALLTDRRTDVAFFGFFDAQNDPEAVAAISDAMENAAIQEGKNRLEGPYNPQYYCPSGILLNSFDSRPALYQTWNPPYYAALLENAGYTEYARGKIWKNNDLQAFLRREFPVADVARRSGSYSVRPLSFAGSEAGDALAVINGSFGENLRYQPVGEEEYRYTLRLLLPAVEGKLTAVAYRNDVPVGAALCLRDITPVAGLPSGSVLCDRLRLAFRRSRLHNLVVFAIAMLPEHRGSRAALLLRNVVADMARNFDTAESTWITVGNAASEQMAVRFGMTPHKEFAIVGKNLP